MWGFFATGGTGALHKLDAESNPAFFPPKIKIFTDHKLCFKASVVSLTT